MIDSHLHITDGVPEDYSDFGSLTRIVSCSARPSEWDPQSAVADDRIIRSYGVHPWYAEEWTLESRVRLYDILRNDASAQVGEIGLDTKRGTILGQMMVFLQQMDAAEYFGRVVSIHNVGCEKMVLDAVKERKLKGTILHSYGSDSYVKPFSELECYFSISPRILSRSDIRVKRLMESIPPDRLLLETDSPHFPQGFTGMMDFAERLSASCGIPADDLVRNSEENLRRLFP